jgi:hypothetical protein
MKRGICFLVEVDKSNSLSVSLVLPRAFIFKLWCSFLYNKYFQASKYFPCVCRLRGQGHPVCLPPAGILVVDKGLYSLLSSNGFYTDEYVNDELFFLLCNNFGDATSFA